MNVGVVLWAMQTSWEVIGDLNLVALDWTGVEDLSVFLYFFLDFIHGGTVMSQIAFVLVGTISVAVTSIYLLLIMGSKGSRTLSCLASMISVIRSSLSHSFFLGFFLIMQIDFFTVKLFSPVPFLVRIEVYIFFLVTLQSHVCFILVAFLIMW